MNHCVVDNFRFVGKYAHKYYYYAIYHNVENDLQSSDTLGPYNVFKSFVLFESQKDSLTFKVIWSYEAREFAESMEAIRIVETKYGLMHHTYLYNGNGGWDDGGYYLHKDGRWIELMVPDWRAVFASKIPDKYWLCRGTEIDLKTMAIDFNVFKPGDGCCCPSGGVVYAKLGIKKNSIEIQEVKYSSKANK